MTATAEHLSTRETRPTRSVASVMHDAITISRDTGTRAAVYRDTVTRQYFAATEPHPAPAEARFVCWIDAVQERCAHCRHSRDQHAGGDDECLVCSCVRFRESSDVE